jgi:putative transposase
VTARRELIEPDHPELTVLAQCELLGLARSSYYYESVSDTQEDHRVMRLIDRLFTQSPQYGSRRITWCLRRDGEVINRKRVGRLMQLMGLCAIYPRKRKKLSEGGERRLPYLLGDVAIVRPDQVWSTDITYIPLRRGFLYLMAIIDWLSRYVLAWRLSNTLEPEFCVEALEEALARHRPEFFNSDQGSQFTCPAFTAPLLEAGVKISMVGKGRVFDNIFVERLWRTVKYEEVYLGDYAAGPEATKGLTRYFDFYNHRRPHQSLGYKTPGEVYGHRAHRQ